MILIKKKKQTNKQKAEKKNEKKNVNIYIHLRPLRLIAV